MEFNMNRIDKGVLKACKTKLVHSLACKSRQPFELGNKYVFVP